ncbi:PREDICTED: receptor-type tyrosine-protein phosphatase H [Chrysochloris asiatica]|uniref:Receptor-type tyrosine-protein phosphatase H n=1 Tax=Chrysochloris asiatica TaxID=185453 RepID=A0A9B0TV96_CHRAS|nr:PREDICTED: receptor-type tyrosine-protein phosphatase H [Chrysochloris asiatica]
MRKKDEMQDLSEIVTPEASTSSSSPSCPGLWPHQWAGKGEILELKVHEVERVGLWLLGPWCSVWRHAWGQRWPQGLGVPGVAVPNPVTDLRMQDRTNSSITLTWTAPQGPDQPPYTYWVQWLREDIEGTQNTTDPRITVNDLQAGTLYTFTVWAEKNGVNGTNQTINESTDFMQVTQNTTDPRITVNDLEAGTLFTFTVWAERNGVNGTNKTINESTVPNTVESLKIQDRTNSSITLNWAAPLGPAQPPYTYCVQLQRGNMDLGIQQTSDSRITRNDLKAGTLYTFTVWTQRNGVSSDNSTLIEATVPNEVIDLQNTTQTKNSVRLNWKPPTDTHTQLYVYWIQWASGGQPQKKSDPLGDKINQTGKTNETWYVVKALAPGTLYNFTVWAEMNNVSSSTQSLRASTAPDPVTIMSCMSTSDGYGVILTWSCPSGGYEVFSLDVGGQHFQDSSMCGETVTLLGLQPARSYPAIVTTVWDGMRAPSASMTCYTESAGVIIGAIVGVLLLLILVVLLVFFLKKRNNKHKEKLASRDLAFSFPLDILVEDFADHVRTNEKDSNCGFAEEYQQLALEGHDQLHIVASAPENNTKNRYKDVFPYDWSRVPLKPLHGEPGSDYINANFIPGLWNSQEFIAAQGPLPQTIGDFWRLVWEQQSHTLVMLTNCVESGRVKCEHYWPLDSQTCTHGQLQVTLVEEEVTEDWTIRDLKLFHMEEQKTLSVRQFHFLAWPDHGVPHSPDPLLAFWKVLRKWLDQNMEGGPPIVHCSAGVGRTGTLIALDVLLRQLMRDGLVGPFSFVRKMRGSRPLMVQTEAQYVFLHQCILRFLQQSPPASVEKEVMYENVKNILYENVAEIQDQKWAA